MTVDGKTWRIGHPTQKAKTTLENLVAAKACAEVDALEGVIPPDSYKKRADALMASITAGHYRTGGKGWIAVAFDGIQGHRLFVLSLLRENHPDATEDDVRKLFSARPREMQIAILAVVPSFLSLLLSEMDIPQKQREELQGMFKAGLEKAMPSGAPTPPTTPGSSNSGARHSAANRGASTRSKSHA